jgi:hypothetical protein
LTLGSDGFSAAIDRRSELDNESINYPARVRAKIALIAEFGGRRRDGRRAIGAMSGALRGGVHE